MRVTANPFLVNFGFLGNNWEIVPGSSPELYVSIKNRGDQNVVIDIFIEVTDKDSKALSEWVTPKRVRLTLNAGEDKTVNFQILIPDNAWAYDYRYDVVLDSPEHYPEYTPLIYPQILKVIPAPVTLKHGGEDPSFLLSPVTTSAEPKTIKAGETFAVEVLVENRTNLVDRFHLICSDLKPEFFSVQYPEIKNQYGLVVESDGLELNPGKQAKVKIKFHPPYDATAGNYYPTIRLASVNNPRLNLLDIVYLHVPPSYELGLEIDGIKDRLKDPKTESGEYQLRIRNQGNVERNLLIKGRNRGWGGLTFSIDPDFKTLAPGAMSQVQLLVKPIGRWWNRPFYGMGREFRFCADFEDMRSLPLPNEFPEAKLTWEPYPKKWFIFFIVLLSLLAAGGAIAIAITVWNVFFKQPPTPKAIELAPTKTFFKEANNEVIQLNWKIQNAKNISQIVLNQQGPNGNEVKTFNFRAGIPKDIVLRNPNQTDNYCEFQKIKEENNLICRGITTSARKPGQYQFDLQVFKQKELQKPVSVLKTDTIRVIPAGLPSITEFVSPRPEYLVGQPANSTSPILLNWDIANPAQIDQIKLVGLAKDGTFATSQQNFNFQNGKVPKMLESFCKFGNTLTCRNVPMRVKKPGLYTFRLSVESKQGGEIKSLTKVTDVIQVKSIPTINMPTRLKSPGVPNPTNSAGSGVQGNPKQPKQKFNELINPDAWPEPNSRGGGSSSFRPRTNANTGNSPDYRESIRQANDIEKGLVVANDVGRIKTNSQSWRKIQDAIAILRKGKSLAAAAQQSEVSIDLLSSLIAWGQGKQLPPKDMSQNSTQSMSPQTKESPTAPKVSRPPEPVWGGTQPSSNQSSQNEAPFEPLW